MKTQAVDNLRAREQMTRTEGTRRLQDHSTPPFSKISLDHPRYIDSLSRWYNPSALRSVSLAAPIEIPPVLSRQINNALLRKVTIPAQFPTHFLGTYSLPTTPMRSFEGPSTVLFDSDSFAVQSKKPNEGHHN